MLDVNLSQSVSSKVLIIRVVTLIGPTFATTIWFRRWRWHCISLLPFSCNAFCIFSIDLLSEYNNKLQINIGYFQINGKLNKSKDMWLSIKGNKTKKRGKDSVRIQICPVFVSYAVTSLYSVFVLILYHSIRKTSKAFCPLLYVTSI